MKKILSTTFLLFIFIASFGQSAYECIEDHREWMRTNYPKAENLSLSQQLREASFAIYNELKEPEALSLLHAVGKDIKEVEDYATFEETNGNDYHFAHTLCALEALYHNAKQQLGRDNATTSWCKYLWLTCLSNMKQIYPMMDAEIEEQNVVATRTKNKENEALLCLMKFLKFETSEQEYLVCSPDLYDEVLQTEKEAIKLYPFTDKSPSHMRAWLYMTLGNVKKKFTAFHESELAYQKAGLIENSYYGHNVNTGIMSNADYYYQMAEEAYLQLYKPGHPEVIEMYVCQESAREDYNTLSDENITATKSLYDYSTLYYGRNHLSTLLRKLDYWHVSIARGKEVNDAFMWNSIRENIMRYLGEDNINYTFVLNYITQLVALCYSTDTDEAALLYEQSVARTIGTNNMKAAVSLYLFYGYLKDLRPDLFRDKAVPQATFYVNHHDSSLTSIAFGRRLAIDYYSGMQNLKDGINFQQMVCEDVKQKYGEKSYVYMQEKGQEIDCLSSYDRDAARAQYPAFIQQMKDYGFDHITALNNYANLENNAGELKHADELLQQAYCESADDGATHKRAFILLQRLNILPYISAPIEEQEKIYNDAKKILDTNQDTLRWMPECYSLAADWLCTRKRFHEALEMLNRGIQFCDWKDTGFSPTYIGLITRRYSVYMYDLDDINMAYKLMYQDLEAFEKDNFSYYTIDMLDYLWNVYNLMPKNESDWFNMSKYANIIMKMTLNIAQQNNNEPNFVANYGVRLLQALVNMAIIGKNLQKQVNKSAMSEEQRNTWDKTWETINNNLDVLSGIESVFTNLHSSIPHYEQQITSYFNLLDAIENYFLYLNPNKEKAITYLKIHMDHSKQAYHNEFINACQKLFDFYLQEKEYEKAQKLYAEIFKQEENKEGLPESVKLTLYSRMCQLCLLQQKYDAMLPYARKYFLSLKNIFSYNFQLLTEQEQNALTAFYGDPANWLTCCMAGIKDKQSMAAETYDAVLYRTGIQLRSQQKTREAILKSNNQELIALVDSLKSLRSQQKVINYDTNQESQEELNKKYTRIADFQKQINLLERDIIERSKPYLDKTSLDASWTQIRNKLKADEAAIEFTYAHPYWMALVVTQKCKTPKAIRLVLADSLTEKIKSLNAKTQSALAKKLYNADHTDLYALLWEPLESELNGIHKIYYATQGFLSSFSFDAIVCPDKKYLVDHYDLYPLTTTAQLLFNNDEQQPKSILIMGDIYYSEKQQEQVNHGDINAARGDDEDISIDDFTDRGSKRYHFRYLPYTKDEIENLKKAFTNKSIKSIENMEATEHYLRQQLTTKPHVVHLATHGFFIANDAVALRVPFFKRYAQTVSNSMQRAGVALAGAEDTWNGSKTPPEKDDGILTANEVAQMDLSNTQLVTLSACETALGDYSFEGVFGLPRGFKQAGVKSLLVSLWSVNDQSTSQLMSAFYHYWMKGQTKHMAFRNAINDVRKKYPDPYYWAPFILLDATK